MTYIVPERWDRLKARIRPLTWQRVKNKAQWERVSLSAVVKDWPSILPKALRSLAASCFADNLIDLYAARRKELTRMLRHVERELKRHNDREDAAAREKEGE